jgi:two-component SAPR family response regulator
VNGRAATPEQPSPVEPAASASEVAPQISVLGPLTITDAERSRRGLCTRALELIAYLALHPRPVHSDQLLEAFCPGEDPRRTRPRLRQAVRDARRLLGDAIAGEHERYWVDREQADVDLDEVEGLLAAADRAAPGDAQALMENALGLFRGEPFAGADYAWSESELPRLRATFAGLLEQVARHRLKAGEARAALDAAERGLEVDGLNESLWRLAMEAESALGLRQAVAERYERLRATARRTPRPRTRTGDATPPPPRARPDLAQRSSSRLLGRSGSSAILGRRASRRHVLVHPVERARREPVLSRTI